MLFSYKIAIIVCMYLINVFMLLKYEKKQKILSLQRFEDLASKRYCDDEVRAKYEAYPHPQDGNFGFEHPNFIGWVVDFLNKNFKNGPWELANTFFYAFWLLLVEFLLVFTLMLALR